jgi:hypothetical protein
MEWPADLDGLVWPTDRRSTPFDFHFSRRLTHSIVGQLSVATHPNHSMSSHKRRREDTEEKDEERRVEGRVASSAADDGERKESREQPAEADAAGRIKCDDGEDQPAAAAAAVASPPFSSSSRLIPPPADLPECDVCRLPLQSEGEPSGAPLAQSATTRVPRLLPCGHCLCTTCINDMLQCSDQ